MERLQLRGAARGAGCKLDIASVIDDPLATRGNIILSLHSATRLVSTHDQAFTIVADAAQLSRDLPGVHAGQVEHLDARGLPRIGARLRTGDILVGRRIPDARGQWIEASLRVPPAICGTVIAVRESPQEEGIRVEVELGWERQLERGDVLADERGRVFQVADIRDNLTSEAAWDQPARRVTLYKIACARERMSARSIGPYALLTEQPLGGPRTFGGQLIEPAELALLGQRGAEITRLEWMTIKSDNPRARMEIYESIIRGQPQLLTEVPVSLRLLASELLALGLQLDLEARQLQLVPAGSDALRARCPKVVRRPDMIDLGSHQPLPGGLFCEEIFGRRGSTERREQLGRIELAYPVLHPWFAGAVASLLGIEESELFRLIDHEAVWTPRGTCVDAPPSEPPAWERTGALAVRQRLAELDLAELGRMDNERGRQAGVLRSAGLEPTFAIVDVLPVLPPDLRPIVCLDGGRITSSDLNELYRRVVSRNVRLRQLMAGHAPALVLHNEAVQLQGAIDALMNNGFRRRWVRTSERRPLVSLTHLVAGRLEILLHKRVDYSGVAVLVPDPRLDDTTCNLPASLALELFRPFVYGVLQRQGQATTLLEAREMLAKDASQARRALDEATHSYPVLLMPFREEDPSLAPAVVACDVKIWEGAALCASPAVCEHLAAAEVAIHVPLSPEAVEEARTLLRLDSQPTPLPTAEPGWLMGAIGRVPEVLVGAALSGELDPVADPLTCLALGRRLPRS
jgi:hypothetical protein